MYLLKNIQKSIKLIVDIKKTVDRTFTIPSKEPQVTQTYYITQIYTHLHTIGKIHTKQI